MKRLKITKRTVGALRADVRKCLFAIPRLQREFVWRGPQAAALWDSIYRGMPIGTLMIWRAPRKRRHLLRRELHLLPEFNKANKEIRFLVDGQQRLTVIYQSSIGEVRKNSDGREIDFGRISFRLVGPGKATEEWPTFFSYRKPVSGQWVSVSSILDGRWRDDPGISASRAKRIEDCRSRLLTYPVPCVTLDTSDLEEVREAFVRINSQGMRITSADRAFARASRLDLRERAHDLRDKVSPRYGSVDYEAIMTGFGMSTAEQATAPDVGERALEALVRNWERAVKNNRREIARFGKLWEKYERAVLKACDYLRDRFEVRNDSLLPSKNMVAMLSTFFYRRGKGPNPKQAREIKKWFWSTAVCQRYSGRGYRTNLAADWRFFRRLARSSARFTHASLASRAEVRRTEYTQPSSLARACLCLLVSRRPRSFATGERIQIDEVLANVNKRNRHHIFPQNLMNAQGLLAKDYNSLANICLLSAEENISIRDKSPRRYLGELRRRRHFKGTMRSHLIDPYDDSSGLWIRGIPRAFERFCGQRTASLAKAFEQEAGIRLFRT